MKSGPRLAIDFGTTRTKVAFYDAEREEAKLVELGIAQREIVPSVFYVPKKDAGEILVGDDALAQLDVDPAGIVREIKREIDKLGKKRCGAGRLAPTRIELAAELLGVVRRRCEEGVFHGQTIDKCTLTVPVSFTESQRGKLVEAANLAGFNDVRLMDEPTAAARAWVEKQGERFGDHVIVVDIGGGTTDFSVVEWTNNRFSPHSSVLPDGFLQGGNDIDDHACDELLAEQDEEDEETVLRLKDSFLVKLRSVKEQFTRGLKRQSVSAGSAKIEINPNVFRAAETEFVNRLCDELQAFFEKCKHAGIDSPVVLLVGGASRITGLADMLNEICPREVFTWESADFATVLGAVDYPGNETGFESVKQRKAQASYIEALKAANADEKITSPEFTYLTSRRIQLGLDELVAQTLERQVLGATLGDLEVVDADVASVVPAEETVLFQVENLIRESEFDQAIEQLQIQLDMDANVPQYQLLKATAYFEQRRFALASSAANVVIKLSSDEPKAYFIRGVCRFFLGDFVNAKMDLSKSQESDELSDDAQFYLSSLEYQMNDRVAAFMRLGLMLSKDESTIPKSRFIAATSAAAYIAVVCKIKDQAVALVESTISAVTPLQSEPSVLSDAVMDLKLFFADSYANFESRFCSEFAPVQHQTARKKLLNDETVRCPDCQLHSTYDGEFCSYCKQGSGDILEAAILDGKLLNPTAATLFEANQIVSANEEELARNFVRSCCRSGLSVRCIERFGNPTRLKAALSEVALLSRTMDVSAEDMDGLLATLLSNVSVDIRTLREEANVRKVDSLVRKLTPTLTVSEDHGAVFNCIEIKNESCFAVHDVCVVALVLRADDSKQQVTRLVDKLDALESHRWETVFEDPGWFGGNITSVSLETSCRES